MFGLRASQVPDTVRKTVVQDYPRAGFKQEFARLLRAEAKQVPHGRAWYLHRFALSDVTIRLAPFRGSVGARSSTSDSASSARATRPSRTASLSLK